MNIGLEIVSSVLRERTLEPYLKAGFTKDWLRAKRDSSDIFHDDDYQVYDSLLAYWDQHGKVPNLEVFRHEYPERTYRLSDRDLTPAELVDLAAKNVRRLILVDGLRESVELYEKEDMPRAVRRMEEAVQAFHKHGTPAGQSSLPLLDISELDDSPAKYRIKGIMPWEGTVLLAASAKTGKSTLTWNMAHAVATGEEFLGRATDYDGERIVYAAFEMEDGTLKEYATSAGVKDGEIKVMPLKGRASDFNVLDPAVRAALADQLAHVEILILDPIGPLLASLHLDENSNSDVSRFREACEALMHEAGISLLFLVHHTGHGDKGRARGASVLMDWPDVLWSYTGQDDAPRELKVNGRKCGGDFHVGLTSPTSGRIMLTEEEEFDRPTLAALLDPDNGQTVSGLAGLIGKSRQAAHKELQAMETKGLARREPGHGRTGDLWYAPKSGE